MSDAPPSEATPRSVISPGRPRGIRWWPAYLVLGLGAAAWVVIGLVGGLNHQQRNLRWFLTSLLTFVLLLLWSVLFARFARRLRWAALGAVVALMVVLGGFCRIRGVTGDLLPILEWRWRTPRVLPLAAAGPAAPRISPASPAAAGYPGFLGPNRDAILPGPRLARDWKLQPPQPLWRHAVGAAWSGFAVQPPYAVTQEQRGAQECVVAYDWLTGLTAWSHTDEARYFTTLAGEGPRATPTIADGRVFALGATGRLNCLDLASGKLIWTKNILDDNGGRLPEWGVSGSPLVWQGRVVVNPGGPIGRSLVAYAVETGAPVWRKGNGGGGYSSPCLVRLGGVEQILSFNGPGVAGHDAHTGEVLWEHHWPGGHPHVTVPIVCGGDRVLISSGYGTGSELVRVQPDGAGRWSASRVWKSLRLKAKFANLVQKDGYVYGLDDGLLACLDAAVGEQKWRERGYGHGQVILVGDLLLIGAENGDVALVEPTPQEHRLLARIPVFGRKTWNPPALAGEYLFVRNDVEAAVLRLPLASR